MDQVIKNSQGETLEYTFHAGQENARNLLIIGHGVTGKQGPAIRGGSWLKQYLRKGCRFYAFPFPVMEDPGEIFGSPPFPRKWKI